MPAPTTLELLWGAPSRPKRGPKPSLTLDRIVTEAVALADAEGLANLSMQRLAERLGCAKMALYRYVPGKSELNALMLESALGAAPEPAADQPDSPELPWRAYLRSWAQTFFDRAWAHPWTLELSTGARPMGPNEMSWLESALAALADSGLTAAERLDTVVLLIGHARGLVQQAGATPDGDAEGRLVKEIGAILSAHRDRYPHVVSAFTDQATVRGEGRNNALHYGIDRILDGVGALINNRKQP
ncbi:TetR/AcrR family transcriptional regulator [Nocardia crassostreae]|uniref:TetR/AcrR family transcriptional regulator n=1 Tax=Nocardia crassostreae TaxID=53428 RepID=UPI0008319723|nr:TetR/AcrR family transcriptional regulator [Nocardia crassostreae]